MSEEPNHLMSSDKKPVNSLLNAFVPDDLVTFPMPVTILPAITTDVTSEIDLAGDDDEELAEPLPSGYANENNNNPVVSELEPIESESTAEKLKLFSGLDKPNLELDTVTYYSPLIQPVASAPPQPLQDENVELTHVPFALDGPIISPQLFPYPQNPSIYEISNPQVPPTMYSNPPQINSNSEVPVKVNTSPFRRGSHKPVYAKYPGLTSGPTSQQQILGMQDPVNGFENLLDVNKPRNFVPVASTNENEISYCSHELPPPDVPFYSPVSYEVYGTFPYKPVNYHWFYRKETQIWKPFSYIDSKALEAAFCFSSNKLVSVDGGRQDVDLEQRIRKPVYWEDTDVTHVQRCSWFYKGPMDSQFIPYSEEFSARLEAEYEQSIRTNSWHKRLEFAGGEAVVLQNPNSFLHFCQEASADEWGSVPEHQLRPRVVKRGTDGLHILPGEPTEVDYLVFLVHGIGSVCDFKFRSVVETVDDFRQISDQLLQSHFKDTAGRVEFLPVQWHNALHGDGGIDEKLKPLTLKSIPKLRHFTNDTLLDILFYTSPIYCQTIMNTVGKEMNRMYALFLERNPTFNCLSVAVGGHSLGSLILFDLLLHQPEIVPIVTTNSTHESDAGDTQVNFMKESNSTSESGNRMVSYTIGSAGTGQPFISYPALDFQPNAFFAMGSPIAMFVAVRGLDCLGQDFHLPTCPAFFNIFHPYDPVAYRMESLIDPKLDLRPVLIPHHKGRKRFHLEFKETMARVGTELRNRVMESLRVTFKAVTQLAGVAEVEQEVNKAIASELNTHAEESHLTLEGKDERVGSLNGGRRIDYVLQEAPHQILNEYLFALSSHVCYWESEDTVLLILNEILNEGRSSPSTPERTNTPLVSDTALPLDTVQLPDQSFSYFKPEPQEPYSAQFSVSPMPPQFPNNQNLIGIQQNSYNVLNPPLLMPGESSFHTSGTRPMVDPYLMPCGMDPTAPISTPQNLGPPPKSGFQPKM